MLMFDKLNTGMRKRESIMAVSVQLEKSVPWDHCSASLAGASLVIPNSDPRNGFFHHERFVNLIQ